MKTKILKFFIFIIIFISFTSCFRTNDKYDGFILTDQNNNKYILKHNIGDTYFIYKSDTLISGKDTILVFK